MATGCWIDWIEGPWASGSRRRMFGPTDVEPLLLGLATDGPVSLRAGPTASVVIVRVDGSEFALAPSRRLDHVDAATIASVRLRAA